MSTKSALAIVLAAGKGTRMKSELPKVLAPIHGRPMIRYVIDALNAAGIARVVVVVGYRGDLVQQELADVPGVVFAEQKEQLGTGHAVMMCRATLANHQGPVVVVAGDSPLLQSSSVAALLQAYEQDRCGCVLGTVHADDPSGLGRIVRDQDGEFVGIVEEKDATQQQKAIDEINMSTYLFDAQGLLSALERLRADNAQNEYYLTDCPAILREAGQRVLALAVLKPCEALGVNSTDDLAKVEAEMSKDRRA